MNTALSATTSAATPHDSKKAAPTKKYKSVPENWKTLPEPKFRQVIAEIESVLLGISTDGVSANSTDGRIPEAALIRWADHLRAALKALTGGN